MFIMLCVTTGNARALTNQNGSPGVESQKLLCSQILTLWFLNLGEVQRNLV